MTYQPKITSVPEGGTGIGSLTANGVICGNGTNVVIPSDELPDGQTLVGYTSQTPRNSMVRGFANICITGSSGSFTISNPQYTTPVGIHGPIDIGYVYSGGVFSIKDGDGNDLHALNKAYINIRSKTGGLSKGITLTANQTFSDATSGASTIIGNLFGTTTGIAWANACPFYVYAILDDTETTVCFAISRVPHLETSPAAAYLGKTGSAVASTCASMFLFGDPTVADYEGNPCIAIGSLTMTKSAADDWTVSSTSLLPGELNEPQYYTFPQNQVGAAAGTHFLDNGGTAPVFLTAYYYYSPKKNGDVKVIINLTQNGGGVGAVDALLSLPITWRKTITAAQKYGEIGIVTAATTTSYFLMDGVDDCNTTYLKTTAGGRVQYASFSDPNDKVVIEMSYPMALT